MGKILIRQQDEAWHEPGLAGNAAGAELQHILADHPELIPKGSWRSWRTD